MTDKDSDKNPNDGSTFQGHGEADLAGEFLAKALKHSFIILKVIMVILVILFITSGIFRVEQNENALVLRFGRIQEFRSSETGEFHSALGPGLHWNWPEPITEIIKIPVKKKQTVAIDSFWYYQSEAEKLGTSKGYAGPTLDPRKDGYCLTRNDSITGQGGADYNIVHGKWQLTYFIDDIERFFRNIYYKTPRPGEDFLDVVSGSVDPLLKAVASDAIAATMVNYTIEQAIVNDESISGNIKRLIEEKLSRLDSGIAVHEFQVIGKITWPRQVDKEFQQSSLASQKRDETITDARSYADTILSAAGGGQAAEMLRLLKQPDLSEQDRRYYLSQLAGTSQEIIAGARAYHTTVVETAKANADYFQKLLPEYRQRPKLVVQSIYQDAIEQIFDNATEKFIIQSSASGKRKEFRILLNSDPALRKQEVDEAKKQAGN